MNTILNLNNIKRCAFCNKPVLTGKEAHNECQKDYDSYAQDNLSWWNEELNPNEPANDLGSGEWEPPTDEDLAWENEYARKIEAEMGLNMGPRLTLIQ